MLSLQERRCFTQNGYLNIAKIFTPHEIQKLRQAVTDLFEKEIQYQGDTEIYRMDLMCRHPQFRWVLAHPPLLMALRQLFGPDFVLIHGLSIHNKNLASAWHKDTTTAEKRGVSFHWDSDFAMSQSVIYLQDNSVDYGGGLNAIPGSHMTSDGGAPQTFTENFRHDTQPYTIPSEAGDLTLFHLRTTHAATPIPPHTPADWPHKMGLFFISSAHNRHVDHQEQWQRDRGDYDYLEGHEHYSPELEDYARERLLHLAQMQNPPSESWLTPPEKLSVFWPDIHPELRAELEQECHFEASADAAEISVLAQSERLSQSILYPAQAESPEGALGYWVTREETRSQLLARGVADYRIAVMPERIQLPEAQAPRDLSSHPEIIVCLDAESFQGYLNPLLREFVDSTYRLALIVQGQDAEATATALEEAADALSDLDFEQAPDLLILEDELSLQSLEQWAKTAGLWVNLSPAKEWDYVALSLGLPVQSLHALDSDLAQIPHQQIAAHGPLLKAPHFEAQSRFFPSLIQRQHGLQAGARRKLAFLQYFWLRSQLSSH